MAGQLLGLDNATTLEVTNCFPFPSRVENEESSESGADYQIEMMRYLRDVNVDSNTVGWYQVKIYFFFDKFLFVVLLLLFCCSSVPEQGVVSFLYLFI